MDRLDREMIESDQNVKSLKRMERQRKMETYGLLNTTTYRPPMTAHTTPCLGHLSSPQYTFRETQSSPPAPPRTPINAPGSSSQIGFGQNSGMHTSVVNASHSESSDV